MIKKSIILPGLALIALIVVGILVIRGLAPQAENLPLSASGPYFVGRQTLTFVDSTRTDSTFHRESRKLVTEVIYPATKPEDLSTDEFDKFKRVGMIDAKPDVSGAPYPLILFSHAWTSTALTDIVLFTHLASHGFVVVSIEHSCDTSPECLVDRPMDVFFVLNEIAGLHEGNLAGMIDTDHVGVMGISFGGYTTLAAAGAQNDPEYFLKWAATDGLPTNNVEKYVKNTVADQWGEVAAYRAQFDTLRDGQPWPSVTDKRIRAILPIVPAFGMLFGNHGLETVAVPTLMMAATKDQFVPYEPQITQMYAQLGPADHYLISFIGYDHHPENHAEGMAYYKHFSTAFFGYYLQGQKSYAPYLTADFVNGFDDLAWGVIEGK